LDPAAGTLLNLARCREKIGQTASAWATYHDAVTAAKAVGQVERERAAREGAAALEPSLPRLTIVVSPEARAANPQVRRDGVDLPSDLWGVTLPVDPGEHLVEATSPGKQRWAVKTSVQPRGTAIITVPPLAAVPAATAPTMMYGAPTVPSAEHPSASNSTQAPSAAKRETADASSGWSGAKTAALVVAGVGVAGLTVGAVQWARFEQKKDEANTICPGSACHEPEHTTAVGLLDEANSARTIGIVAGGIGAAALVGAAVLWFTAPAGGASNNRVAVSPTTNGRDFSLSLSGAW
jgi:hypothetical protein